MEYLCDPHHNIPAKIWALASFPTCFWAVPQVKKVCAITLCPPVPSLTFEAIAPCKQRLTETRDSKIIKPHRTFRKKRWLSKKEPPRVEIVTTGQGRAGSAGIRCGGAFSTACGGPLVNTSTSGDEPQHTMPLAETATRDLRRKHHTEGNTREKLGWRKDHV